MISDETLMLYYYADGLDAADRATVAKALQEDPALRARYDALIKDLGRLSGLASHPVPPALTAQLHASLPGATSATVTSIASASPQEPPRRLHASSFAWGAALAASLLLIALLVLDRGQPTIVDMPETVAGQSGATTFTRGLRFHLASSGEELARLDVESTDRNLLIMQLIDQNRLIERAAEDNDAEDLARVLRAFETILLRLASDDIAPADAEALRAQLAFELKVMLTRLQRDASMDAETI